jgi:phosphoribosylformylglycinamidine synthase
VGDVHVGRHLVLEIDAKDEGDARDQTGRMCAQLLANPVTEDFAIASVSTV